jgi:glycosyltransferase involved in cell wall biosynthesis
MTSTAPNLPHNRLKIALIHQPWSVIEPPVTSADSIALWSDEVARRLTSDCDITCYSRHWGNQPRIQTVNGIEYRHMSVSIDRWVKGGFEKFDEWGLRPKSRPFYASSLCYRQFIHGVLKDLKRLAPHIVHVQNFSQFVPMIRDVLPDTEIILHMHAEWLAQIDRDWMMPRIGEADSVIFCSNFFAQQTRDAWPQYAGRCRVVYNGATLKEFEGTGVERTGPKRLLFVGRVSPDKGVHVLVQAFKQVLEKHPTTELKIVGPFATLPKSFCLSMSNEPLMQDLARFYDSPYVEQLKEMLTPEMAKQTEITGPISRADLVDQFKRCSVLVLPSIYPEGFGIPIVEAAACRAPAVCARRGGMPEVVEQNKTGIIVESGNVDALAAALIRLLDDESLRQQMGNAAYERVVNNFTWDRIAASLLSEYRRLAGHTSAVGPPHLTEIPRPVATV